MADDKRKQAIDTIARAEIYRRASWSLTNQPVDLYRVAQPDEDEIQAAAERILQNYEPNSVALAAAFDFLKTVCCDMHNEHCEPPGDLCCVNCTEARHPLHPPGQSCVLDTGKTGG